MSLPCDELQGSEELQPPTPPRQLGKALKVRERPWSSLGSTGGYMSSLKFERPSVVAHEHGHSRRDCLRQVLPLKESIRNLSWEL